MSAVDVRERVRDSPLRARSLVDRAGRDLLGAGLGAALLLLALLDLLVLAGTLRALLHSTWWHATCLPVDGARIALKVVTTASTAMITALATHHWQIAWISKSSR